MTNELKLGGTYRHYKTNGLYTALQLVKFEPYAASFNNHFLSEVTFTGDGPYEDKVASLYLAFSPGVKLFLDDTNFELQRNKHQVLYWSQQHQRYFVRPLTEFVAHVEVEAPISRSDSVKGIGYSVVPRFELQP